MLLTLKWRSISIRRRRTRTFTSQVVLCTSVILMALILFELFRPWNSSSPREAAMAIARIVNNRNPHISLLALSLLETLVAQCGYPFHLQIATKEFLNEIVRRFPERPPPFPGPVMTRILELIKTWMQTICAESRWKEDLGNIRDMYRLLTFKGYRFRDIGAPNSVQSVVASTSVSWPAWLMPSNVCN